CCLFSLVCSFSFFFSASSPTAISPFPYTTLFRSSRACHSWTRMYGSIGVGSRVPNRVSLPSEIRMSSIANCIFRAFRYPESPSLDRKSTRLNSSHLVNSYAVFCLKKKRPPQGQACPLRPGDHDSGDLHLRPRLGTYIHHLAHRGSGKDAVGLSGAGPRLRTHRLAQ